MFMLEPVIDGGTIIVPVAFTDEDGVAMIPTSVMWTLRDENGAVVNNRQDVVVSPLASTINIVLYGDDVVYTDEHTQRILRVDAVYNGEYGNNLPLPGYARIPVVSIPTTA